MLYHISIDEHSLVSFLIYLFTFYMYAFLHFWYFCEHSFLLSWVAPPILRFLVSWIKKEIIRTALGRKHRVFPSYNIL